MSDKIKKIKQDFAQKFNSMSGQYFLSDLPFSLECSFKANGIYFLTKRDFHFKVIDGSLHILIDNEECFEI